jgi:hypothetical protein
MGAGGAATSGLGCAIGLAGARAESIEPRTATTGAEGAGLGTGAAAPPACHAVGALASLDAAAASCGVVTGRGRTASCAGEGAGAAGEGLWTIPPAGVPAPGATGPVEVGATRWTPATTPGRIDCGAGPGAAAGRTVAGPAARRRVAATAPRDAGAGGSATGAAGSGAWAAGDALGGSAGAGAGTAICSFKPQPRQYLNWS